MIRIDLPHGVSKGPDLSFPTPEVNKTLLDIRKLAERKAWRAIQVIYPGLNSSAHHRL